MEHDSDEPMSITSAGLVQRGTVASFDAHRGLGTVAAESGETYMFHCVEIADGTRQVEVGTAVEFELRTKFSRPEAFALRLLV